MVLFIGSLGAAACGGGRGSSARGGAGGGVAGAAAGVGGGNNGGAGSPGGGSGGAAATAGSGGVAAGGVTGSAGAAGTASGAGGSATGGGANVGGGPAGVGGGAAGAGGSPAGAGGSAAGAGGSAAGAGGSAAGAGGSGDAPMPSAGCALAIPKPATYASTSKFAVVRRFPTSYDGVTPMPLIVALHATGYNASGMASMLLNGQPAAERYVFAAPEAPRSVSTFESVAIFDVVSFFRETLAELCVDQNRIFGIGSGSGARVVIKLADEIIRSINPPGLRFRAAGLVGTFYGAGRNAFPIIFIHPLTSRNSAAVAQDEDGTKALQLLRTRNVCAESSTPVSVAGCADKPTVNPGCADLDECSAPLRWCHHDDPSANQAGDPWPCFATTAIYQFFEPLLGGATAPFQQSSRTLQSRPNTR